MSSQSILEFACRLKLGPNLVDMSNCGHARPQIGRRQPPTLNSVALILPTPVRIGLKPEATQFCRSSPIWSEAEAGGEGAATPWALS